MHWLAANEVRPNTCLGINENLLTMSLYQNIYKDLPNRCMRLWTQIEQSQNPEQEDLTVTTMLVIASAGLAMPWEHLKHESPNKESTWRDHPAFKGVSPKIYDSAMETLRKNFSQKLTQSPLIYQDKNNAWRISECTELKEVRDVAEYGDGRPLDNGKITVNRLLKCMRNALAHNNICAFGNNHGQIDRLSFFSEIIEYSNRERKVIGYEVATISTEGFRYFLKEWFKLIETPHLQLVAPFAIDEEPARIAA